MQILPVKIIIVEDEPVLLRSLAFTLKRQHFSVTTSSSGLDALTRIENEYAKNEISNLLITDIQLPEMSGLELIDTLKEKKIRIPVLVITAYGDQSVISEIQRRNISDFLTKPFNIEDLLEKVRSILNSHSKLVL